MAVRFATISQHIQSSFEETREPVSLLAVLKEAHAAIYPQSGLTRGQLDEWAANSAEQIATLLRAHHTECITSGQPSRFSFTVEGSFEYIHGAYWVQPTDSPELARFKTSRAKLPIYRAYLENVDDRLFEAVCVGILDILGCTDPVITKKSGDQGIDFFGQLKLQGRLGITFALPGPDRRFNAWLVGQAKRYRGSASTPDLRELVGSVDLARAKAFADDGRALERLSIRLCDPVFYLFLTTGRLTTASLKLVEAAGMIALDGESIAALLADARIGVAECGDVAPELIDSWARNFLDS